MRTIIGLYDECHKDHIVTGIYHRQSFRGVGKGISDAVDVKKELDNFYSQRAAYIAAHSTPATYYNQDLISEADVQKIGKPRAAIPVDFSKAPDGVTSINQAVEAIAPRDPGEGIWRVDDQLRNDLQMSFQVTDFSGGLPGVDNKTATGARIGDANAETLLIPQHRNKADHRMRSDKVIFNLFKKYINKPKWFSVNDKNGITKGKYFTGDQFEGVDVNFVIVANSEVPMTPFAQRDALAQLMQFTGGAVGIIEGAMANPDIMGEIATAFGAKLPIPKTADIARICRRRVEQIKEALQIEMQNQQVMGMMFESLGQPMPPMDNTNLSQSILSQLSPPISPLEPYAQQKAQWLSEFLDCDEMQYAPVELRYAIEELIRWQLGLQAIGQGQLQSFTSQASLMANAPMMLGEQAMNAENQQMAQQAQAQQQQQQMQQQQMQLEGQLQAKGMEAQINEKMAEADHQRALAMGDDEHRKAKELEMMKQKKAA
jgi:hypothetical protein